MPDLDKVAEIDMTPTAVSTDPILDRTAAVRQIMELVDLAAAQRATVVVAGASEAGPEIVARAIHIRGDGAGAPFLRLDCSRVRA
ncbi:MAG: sigma 54-interacting transcriptional regulator, partial [Gammaproteobacteria bacterium]